MLRFRVSVAGLVKLKGFSARAWEHKQIGAARLMTWCFCPTVCCALLLCSALSLLNYSCEQTFFQMPMELLFGCRARLGWARVERAAQPHQSATLFYPPPLLLLLLLYPVLIKRQLTGHFWTGRAQFLSQYKCCAHN